MNRTIVVAAENISHSYTNMNRNVKAVDSVTLTVFAGEIVCVMGPSGCGKSTLLEILCTLITPTEGHVSFDGGYSPRTATEKARYRSSHIGYVHQNYPVIPYESALKNVLVPFDYVRPQIKKPEKLRRGLDALDALGLREKSRRKARHLSGGEAQRVGIARAMVNVPKLILADEPTAALDTANALAVMRIFRDHASAGAAIIIATHDARISQLCDRTLHLIDGKVSDGLPLPAGL